AHDLEKDSPLCDLFRHALVRGFVDSLNMTSAEKLAYRACWAFACSRCVSEESPPDRATLPQAETAEMEKVCNWLAANAAVKKILLTGQKRKTLDKADTLRGSYRNALAILPRAPSPKECGDLSRHAARPERRGSED